MELSELIAPAIVAASVSGVVSLIGAVISNKTSAKINREKIAADLELADRRFRYEREMHDYKRRVELGEDLLANFYQLRDIMSSVRNPAASGNEGETRERLPGENADLARSKDLCYVPIERFSKNSEFFGAFFSRRYRGRSLFGNELEEAFRHADQAIAWVRFSAGMLWRTVGYSTNFEKQHRWENDVWEGFSEVDRVALKIDEAIEAAELSLGPTLMRPPPNG